jgi:hypothetical protein
MQPLKYTRSEDYPATPRKHQSMSLDSLLGTWTNTNAGGKGVAKLIVSQEHGAVYLRIFGCQFPSLIDWGKVPIETVYAKDVDSAEPMAFEANYDLGFMDVQVQANFSLGLLVLACFNIFKDQSGRQNYFSREFFRREKVHRQEQNGND